MENEKTKPKKRKEKIKAKKRKEKINTKKLKILNDIFNFDLTNTFFDDFPMCWDNY